MQWLLVARKESEDVMYVLAIHVLVDRVPGVTEAGRVHDSDLLCAPRDQCSHTT